MNTRTYVETEITRNCDLENQVGDSPKAQAHFDLDEMIRINVRQEIGNAGGSYEEAARRAI